MTPGLFLFGGTEIVRRPLGWGQLRRQSAPLRFPRFSKLADTRTEQAGGGQRGSATSAYESEAEIVQTGVTPILRYDSLDRLVRTDFPDGTFTKVEFDSWTQKNWDQNDTVLQSQWYLDRGSPPATDPEPSTPDARAAWLSAHHANTPTVAHLDTLGRPFLSVAHNRTNGIDELYKTKTKLDIEGNTLAIFDARQIARAEQLGTAPLPTIEQTFDVLQRRIKVISADAGTRLTVADVAGKPLRTWDSRGQTHRQRFDALQRPTHGYVRKGSTERLLLRTVYGESLDPPGLPPTNPASASPAQQANLRGRAVHVYDCAGLVTSIAHDFKGNLLSASRRLAVAYQSEPDWLPADNLTDPAAILGAVLSLLQSEIFTTSSTFDALNRVTTSTTPDGSITRPVYNEANLLEALHTSVRGAAETPVITNLDYNARGQRTLCQYQNGTVTTYQYDPNTFRLTELITLRGATKLQHLLYTYDPVGNITDIRDLSDWDSVLNALTAAGISGSGRYRYDALYRLVSASGREHPGPQPEGSSSTEPPRWGIPHGNDLQALQSYREELTYDEVGNILEMRHLRGPSNSASWSRRYLYADDNNRLLATSVPGDPNGTYSATYGYAANDGGLHGSMTSMPHLAVMEWDYVDRLKHTEKSAGSGQHTYFTYDASGQRVRKVYAHDGVIEERIYLGGYEVFRRHTTGTISPTPEEERQTLHLMDDQRRIAMVETKTRDAGTEVSSPTSRWRFQLDNHLGSATLEVDQAGNVISYEEYHPYGSTAFHTADGNAEVSAKRYRYTGKERDEETGLYYHGARYYAPWLGRWTAADPAGMADGLNLYRYSRDNPIVFADPGGTESKKPFAPVGSADWQIGTRTDAQLLRFLKAMTPEQRGALRESSTGAFQARVDAFNQKYKMGSLPSAQESSALAEQAPNSSDIDFRFFYAVPGAKGEPIAKPGSELSGEALEELAMTEALLARLKRHQEALQVAQRYQIIKARAVLATAESIPVLGTPLLVAGALDEKASPTSRVLSGVGAALSVAPLAGALRGVAEGTEATASTRVLTTGGEGVSEATILREITHGERVKDILGEVDALTRSSNMEHAVVSLAEGERVIVVGGTEGIDLGNLPIRRLLLHSHPPGSIPGPSPEDLLAIENYFQRSSYLLEVEDTFSNLSRFRTGQKVEP